MTQYIDKSALVAEIERRKQVAFGWMETAPNDAIEAEFNLCDDILSFLDTLEVKEIGVDVGSPEGDLGRKTVQVIDADGYVKEIKIQKG